MSDALFQYPKAAAFGRVVPKTKIYEHAGAASSLRDLFVGQVDQVVWKFKLAPETINLPATRSVGEIQIFEICLRTNDLDEAVLRAIDRAIPFPLIFELTRSGNRKAVAAFKRPSDSDPSKWVISEYFSTAWLPDSASRLPLPISLNLGGLYEALLMALIPVGSGVDEDIQARVGRAEAIRSKSREIERIAARLRRVRQFNKRVDINAELRRARTELKMLQQGNVKVEDPHHLSL